MATMKPIFMATHPRACSTAFERVLMTRSDLTCIHEPLGDPFYYGPERLSARFENDEKSRLESGFSQSTFQTVLDSIEKQGAQGKRLFIKDMAYYMMPPDSAAPAIAPSLARKERGIGTLYAPDESASSSRTGNNARSALDGLVESGNPTVLPKEVLAQFHFTFLIRHPKRSIPSYMRCTTPPLNEVTGFLNFMPSEAGYAELRRLFDYCRSMATLNAQSSKAVEFCVIDADELLANPSGVIEAFCHDVGLDYDPQMLKWDTDEDHRQAKAAFEKWKGFHDEAISSHGLEARKKKEANSSGQDDEEWTIRFGPDHAKVVREVVDANMEDYNYLKQFALKP